MAHFIPPILPPFSRGPCPKCGAEAMRVRWCDGSVGRSFRSELCPELDRDHMHLTCATCTYTTACSPLTPRSLK
jgi:hypothetical protein